MLDDRARTLLKALAERYIADGQPVGSRNLSKAAGRDLSPASNPGTSCGRSTALSAHLGLAEGGKNSGSMMQCPKHKCRFDIRDGRALGAAMCVNLDTYRAKVEGGPIYIQV